MDLILNDKVVLVTGGFHSIGKTISTRLCEEGAIPCVLDHDAPALETFVGEMHARGYEAFAGLTGPATSLPGSAPSPTGPGPSSMEPATSLTKPAAASPYARALERIIARYHRINGVVNIAGIAESDPMMSLALPSLKASTGVIVNICPTTSPYASERSPGDVPINGLRQELTIQWAAAFSMLGIRVNGVIIDECRTCPDQPEWIANMVLFLLSQRSASVNGELVYVNH